MERLQLTALLRSEKGKGPARRMRAKGLVPGILYGQGNETVLLSVNPKELLKTLSTAAGTNILFNLQIEGKGAVPAMLKDFQAHVLTRNFIHVDFLQVDLSKKIVVEMPIHLVGKAPGVKEGGILEHITRTLKVRCLPTAIPKALDVDVSHLNIGGNIHVHDLKLPEGIDLLPGADVTIAAVVAPKEEKIEVPTGEIQQPEVLTEKKPAAEEAAPAGKEEKKKEEKKKEEKK